MLFCEAKLYCCRKYAPISESGSKNKRLHAAFMQQNYGKGLKE